MGQSVLVPQYIQTVVLSADGKGATMHGSRSSDSSTCIWYTAKMNIWIGANYERNSDRVMVLGQSWWGSVELLKDAIPRWADGRLEDATFSRLFSAISELNVNRVSPAERLEWWNCIAFYNFVPGSSGELRDSPISSGRFESSKVPLRQALEAVKPRGVWVWGKGQAKYSGPVIQEFGAAYEVAPLPNANGVKNEDLRAVWTRLLERVRQ